MDVRTLHQDLKLADSDFVRAFFCAPIGMAIVVPQPDGQMVIAAVNNALLSMLGLSTVHPDCKTLPPGSIELDKFMPAFDYQQLLGWLTAERAQREPRLELQFLRHDGSGLPCQVGIGLMNMGEHHLFILTADDISSRKAAEQQMLEAAGVEQREDFIATLTHDLKTPIVGANMVLTVLLDGTVGELQREQAEIISKLRASNQALLKMIQNLLDVYKYGSGSQALMMSKVNADDLVKMCLDDLTSLIEEKSIQLDLRVNHRCQEIVCDSYAIQRVLSNLLSNAIKFSPEKGAITLELRDDDNNIIFDITDTGCGINIEDQRRLFQRFWQGQPGKRYAAGTGLGLYFCHHVVRAHGGTISCRSAPGEGTTFTVTLPKHVDI